MEEFLTKFTYSSPPPSRLTPNGNEIHPYLNELFLNGKLDPDVINILLRRQICFLCQGNDQIHLDLMSPMCQILLQWDCSTSEQSPTVTFNNQHYNPLQFISSEDLFTLDQFIDLSQRKRKSFLLGCVHFALRFKQRIHFHSIHQDNKLPFSLFKLCWNIKTEHSHTDTTTLLALIISFVKHALLDTHQSNKGHFHYIHIQKVTFSCILESETPHQPYGQYSHQLLKSRFSSKQSYDLRGNLIRYAQTRLTDEQIEQNLQEFQQFYKELSMINQFCGQPLPIHPPSFYFSDLTYPLAIRLKQSKHFWKDIQTFCSDQQFLFEFIQEIYLFSISNSSSTNQ